MFAHACLPVFFFWWFWVLSLDVWDWKNKNLAREVLQKSTFAEIGFLMIPGPIFHDFGWPWDQFYWILLPWRLAWNLMTFQGDPGVTPDPATIWVGGKLVAGGTLVTTIPDPWNMTLEILRPKLGVLRLKRGYIGYMVHWKRDYTWSFAAWWPPQGGPADF